jgi:5-methyltetrahydrofolate corrinoid/iron sulfur protein methyltransferase
MFLIGENINITSPEAGPALQARNSAPIKQMVETEIRNGIDIFDLNIGPARKGGAELMTWTVNCVQSISGKMLSLDTTNMDAMEAGLKASKNKVLINSVSLQSSRIDRGLELALKYHADIIGLLWSDEGMPRDANERAMNTVNLVYKANQAGITNDRIWIDPIVSPVTVDINQVKACPEFLKMLPEIAPGCKSVVGLSNISNGAPAELRTWLNRTYLIMLSHVGLNAAIVDAYDTELIAIAHIKRTHVINLVNQITSGVKPAATAMTREMENYAKTARVLTGESLYSASWLDV